MLHNTLHEQIYQAIRLFMFYRRILNLIGCARCVRVCVGEGVMMMGARSVRAQFPPYYIRNRIRDRINPDYFNWRLSS